jgi:hypothetical protein
LRVIAYFCYTIQFTVQTVEKDRMAVMIAADRQTSSSMVSKSQAQITRLEWPFPGNQVSGR